MTELTTTSRSAEARRVLVVSNDACTAPELCTGARGQAHGRQTEALVIAPARGEASSRWYVDEDAARASAAHRLRTCIACLSRDGIRVTGEVGDPDPVQAIADALYTFPADEILLVSAPLRPSRWLRRNDIDRARRAFPRQITHVEMPFTDHA